MKGRTIDDCVEVASDLIEKKGICLLLFDVVASRKYSPGDRYLLQQELRAMMDDLNHEFDEYMPEHDIAVYGRREKGFTYLLGDGSWAGISDSSVITEIVNYQKTRYPDIILQWDVASDGYDRENIKIVR
ncbi:MAG: hypothetical protein ACLFTR_00860 [Candidatus Woesearchaeota archaeon]